MFVADQVAVRLYQDYVSALSCLMERPLQPQPVLSDIFLWDSQIGRPGQAAQAHGACASIAPFETGERS